MWQDELDDGPINMLLQTIAIALAAALVVGYWTALWAARQPVVEGLRDE
jgi:putative ABC transport system permease protein